MGEDDDARMVTLPSSVWLTWSLPECGFFLLVEPLFCPPGKVAWAMVPVDQEEWLELALEGRWVHSWKGSWEVVLVGDGVR